MKCIIHVGVHKTGSTSIQAALQGYRSPTFGYANLGDANHSTPFRTLFIDGFSQHWVRLGFDPLERRKYYESLLDDALESAQRNIIFSGEEISHFDEISLRKMRKRLEGKCSEFEVVFVVRDPLNWTASIIQEIVKHGNKPSRNFPSMAARYKNLRKVFTQDELKVIRYEDRDRFDGDVFRLFLHAIGMDLPDNYDFSVRNASLSFSAFKILNIHANFGSLRTGQKFDKSHWDFVSLVGRLYKDSAGLNPLDFQEYCQEEDYEFLTSNFGIRYNKPIDHNEVSDSLERLNSAELRTLSDFLSANGLPYEWSSSQEAAVRALYIYSVSKSLGAGALAQITAARDAAVVERDAAVVERDAAVVERDAAVVERDAAVVERDVAVVERDVAMAERDRAIRYPWKYVRHALRQRLQHSNAQ